MQNIIVQEYNLDIKGKGWPILQSVRGEDIMVPTFGFNSKGEVLSRRKVDEEGGYFPPEQSWIDKQIIYAVDSIRASAPIYKNDPHPFHSNFEKVGDSKEIPEDVPIYVLVLRKSDAPNEIGIATDTYPLIIENSSVEVKKINYYKMEEKDELKAEEKES